MKLRYFNTSFFAISIFFCLLTLTSIVQARIIGDIDNDQDVDRNDLVLLLADRGKTVGGSDCGELCDLDGDGRITVMDARQLVSSHCNLPRCGIITPPLADCSTPNGCLYLEAVSLGLFAPAYDVTPRDEPEFGQEGYLDTYYGKVDPQGERTTLDDWRSLHRFDQFPLSTAHATFINAGDLDPGQTGGLGRDMFCLDDGTSFPCYVQNYADPKGINGIPDQLGRDLIATVAMERMRFTQGVHDRDIVAFFVFDKDGKRVNRIALDGEGAKAVPEQCYGCHMGRTDPFGADGNGDNTVGLGVPAGGQYLPFDIASFENWPGQPTLSDQAFEFNRLNKHVANASKNRKDSIEQLILGWYGQEPGDFVHVDDTYNGRVIPETWYTDPEGFQEIGSPEFDFFFQERSLYDNVYRRYCRTCHVAQGEAQNNYPTRGVDWEKATNFCADAQRVACSDSFTPRMPHAEHTFNRFKTDILNFTNGTSATPEQVLCGDPTANPPREKPICTPPEADGVQLYTTNCSAGSCHGPFEESNKKGIGVTAQQITNAIQGGQPVMSFLDGTLSAEQIQAIADALNIP